MCSLDCPSISKQPDSHLPCRRHPAASSVPPSRPRYPSLTAHSTERQATRSRSCAELAPHARIACGNLITRSSSSLFDSLVFVLDTWARKGEPISLAQVDKLDLQYTYKEGDMYYFMDSATFEEVSIDAKVVGDKSGFFLEGMELSVSTTRAAQHIFVGRIMLYHAIPYHAIPNLTVPYRSGCSGSAHGSLCFSLLHCHDTLQPGQTSCWPMRRAFF